MFLLRPGALESFVVEIVDFSNFECRPSNADSALAGLAILGVAFCLRRAKRDDVAPFMLSGSSIPSGLDLRRRKINCKIDPRLDENAMYLGHIPFHQFQFLKERVACFLNFAYRRVYAIVPNRVASQGAIPPNTREEDESKAPAQFQDR